MGPGSNAVGTRWSQRWSGAVLGPVRSRGDWRRFVSCKGSRLCRHHDRYAGAANPALNLAGIGHGRLAGAGVIVSLHLHAVIPGGWCVVERRDGVQREPGQGDQQADGQKSCQSGIGAHGASFSQPGKRCQTRVLDDARFDKQRNVANTLSIPLPPWGGQYSTLNRGAT